MATLAENPLVEDLLRDGAQRDERPLRLRRERWTEWGFAIALVAAAVPLLLAGPPAHVSLPALVALTALFALATRVEFSVATGSTTAVQLALVPMLLLAPAATPLLVAIAYLAVRLPPALRGRIHPDRLVICVADAVFAAGPALVLVLAGAPAPSLEHWPLYAGMVAAQVAGDMLTGALRERMATGTPIRLQMRAIAMVAGVDAALSPIGVLAAVAAAEHPAGLVAVVPLIGLLAFFAHERERRIEHALALSEAYRGSALLMGEMLEADDPYTGGEHSRGVVVLALAVGRELALDPKEQRDLEFGALLHDIGKLKVPEEILNKPGALDDEEWEIIKRHPEDGQAMLDKIGGVLADVGLTVRSHHERWDGGGYPDGLVGPAIPLNARIVCACDAYSAMTTDRSYRAAMPRDEAIAELRRCAGAQFDPRVVEALAAVVEREEPVRLALRLAA